MLPKTRNGENECVARVLHSTIPLTRPLKSNYIFKHFRPLHPMAPSHSYLRKRMKFVEVRLPCFERIEVMTVSKGKLPAKSGTSQDLYESLKEGRSERKERREEAGSNESIERRRN